MRQINHETIGNLVKFVNSKFSNNPFENVILRIHDDKPILQVTTGNSEEPLYTFAYAVREPSKVIVLNVAGDLLTAATNLELPISNEVQEYAFITDYIISELLNLISAEIQIEYFESVGIYDEVIESEIKPTVLNSDAQA